MATEEEKGSAVYEALNLCLISSDESDNEEPSVLVTRPLTWRTEEVTTFFRRLDERHKPLMTNQQRRQSTNRRVGAPSTRPKTEVPEKLLWATTT